MASYLDEADVEKGRKVKYIKPGVMKRASLAWLVLNGAMLLTLAIIVYMVAPWMANWYIALPILVSVVVTEWMITSETIAPIVRDWIRGEEYVPVGERPSWEKVAA